MDGLLGRRQLQVEGYNVALTRAHERVYLPDWEINFNEGGLPQRCPPCWIKRLTNLPDGMRGVTFTPRNSTATPFGTSASGRCFGAESRASKFTIRALFAAIWGLPWPGFLTFVAHVKSVPDRELVRIEGVRAYVERVRAELESWPNEPPRRRSWRIRGYRF
jgi:hypothetical protein